MSKEGYPPVESRTIIGNGIKKNVDFSLLCQVNELIIFNYPNPARGDKTTFRYYLKEDANVTIDIYDISYEWVENLTAQGKAGENEIVWDISNIARGVYIYVFKGGGRTIIEKVMVIK